MCVRVVRHMFLYGLYSGAVVCVWMELLEKWFPGHGTWVVLKKVFVDHIIATSILTAQFFLCKYCAVRTLLVHRTRVPCINESLPLVRTCILVIWGVFVCAFAAMMVQTT